MNLCRKLSDKKNIIMKLIFPLEFILSLLITCWMFRFMMIRNYEGCLSVKLIVGIIFAGLVVLSLIFYQCKNSKGKLEKIAISFLIPVGMMYVIFMMPSQTPDENAHLMRAYEISEGVLVGRKDSISNVPRDLERGLKPYVETYKQYSDNLTKSTNYNDRVDYPNPAATYPFILYVFSAFGFFIARVFSINILIACYLAKLMNFMVFLIAVYYILKLLPFGKMPMIAAMFMPMFLQQGTSASADCLINIICTLFIAFLLYLYFEKEKLTKKEITFLGILGILMAIVKYVYLPIVGMSLILIDSKNMTKKQKIIFFPILFIVSTIVAGGLFIFTSSYETTFSDYFVARNINASEQIKDILFHPLGFLYTLLHTLKVFGESFIYQATGESLGWLTISIPKIYITAYLFLMVDACFMEKNKVSLNRKQKLLGIFIVIAVSILIITGIYITWNGVGSGLAEGVQGRYFIPILLLALLCLCQKDNYIKINKVEYKLIILLCLLNLPALNAIYQTFMI